MEELATLVLCIKDGVSIEDIRNYICPNIVPVLDKENLSHALCKLFDGTTNSYLMKEETIGDVLEELEKTNLEKLMAITTIISSLPHSKEETLELMIPKELLLNVEKRNKSIMEIVASQELETVSIYYLRLCKTNNDYLTKFLICITIN